MQNKQAALMCTCVCVYCCAPW